MAAGDLWKKIRGVTNAVFGIGGTGGVSLKNSSGVLQVKNAGDSAFADIYAKKVILNDGDTNKIELIAPALGSDYALTFPGDDGSPSQVLTTNGSGTLTWETVAGGTDKPTVDTTALAFGTSSPVTMFTLPANAVISSVKFIVDTAFNGTAPTASVGISGTTSKYMGTTDIDLKTAGTYEVDPGLVAVGSTEGLIITYSADSSSAGAARVLVEYAIPS